MAPSNRFKLDLPQEVRRFTNAEMQAATRQMSKSLMLGMGGFGPVFRLVDKEEGKCAKVGISIASKKDAGVGQGKQEFSNEAKLLYLWQHGRIVSLMGICEGPVPCIIYEHMSRGSLQALMSSDEAAAGFSAAKRIQAAIDVADALDFLHTGGLGPEPPNPRVAHAVVLHRDLNPSNILLNSDYRAKVGDFGLSAMLHENDVQPDVVFSCEQVAIALDHVLASDLCEMHACEGLSVQWMDKRENPTKKLYKRENPTKTSSTTSERVPFHPR